MSPTRPTRWAVAGCAARLLEPLGVALRDSELAATVAVLADPSGWDDATDPQRLARLLHTELVAAAGFPAAEAEAAYVSSATAAGSEGMQLLRALTQAGCALLMEPPLPPGAAHLAGRGASPVLLAAAHLWRWHPVGVIASDLIEAHAIGEILSAEIWSGLSSAPPALAGLLDVLGLILAGDDVAALKPVGPGPDEPGPDEPGPSRPSPSRPGTPVRPHASPGPDWQGRTRGGVPVRIAPSGPHAPADGCAITVTGSRGQIDAAMLAPDAPGGDPDGGRSRLRLVADGQVETFPVPAAEPVRVLVDRFSRAALGASPWGWSFARDLRLQALAHDAGESADRGRSPGS